MVRFTPLPLYLRVHSTRYPLRCTLWRGDLLFLPGVEPRFLGRAACSLAGTLSVCPNIFVEYNRHTTPGAQVLTAVCQASCGRDSLRPAPADTAPRSSWTSGCGDAVSPRAAEAPLCLASCGPARSLHLVNDSGSVISVHAALSCFMAPSRTVRDKLTAAQLTEMNVSAI